MLSILHSLTRNIAQSKATYALIGLYVPLCWAAAVWIGHPERFSLLVYSRAVAVTSLLILVLFFSGVCLRIMVAERPQRLFAAIGHELRTWWLTPARIMQGVPLIVLYMFFMASFSSLKSLIPAFQPYTWDTAWMAWDRAIHGGLDPWRLTHAVFGAPLATFLLNFVYNLWFPVMIGVLFWQAFSLRAPALQKRFMLSFFLTWIVNGTLLAIWLSSAGPCFYERVTGGDHYLPLMERLQGVQAFYPVWSLETQDMLWSVYEERGLHVGSGISAMPSVHVGVAFLLFLFARQKGRACATGFFVFFAAILIGSVHLGWHYAVDGYLAMIVTALIWWLCGFIYREPKS